MAKRQTAHSFAKQWRTDEGELCFTTSLERLAHMVHEGEVIPSFPSLNYVREQTPPNAGADVDGERVPLFAVGAHPTGAWTGGDLKALLREHGAPVTGTKEQLLKKLAKLAADLYADHHGQFDRYFARQRFIRISASSTGANQFPLLEDHAPSIRNLLLTMYALKHLRGNVILDANHENTAYSPEQLAHALLTGKTKLDGAFLRAR